MTHREPADDAAVEPDVEPDVPPTPHDGGEDARTAAARTTEATVTSYAAWTEVDVQRGTDEARVLGELPDPAGHSAAHRPAPDVHADLRDLDGDGTVDEIVVDTTSISGVDSAGRPFGAHGPSHARPTPEGPGLAGVFGAGTPLGEATGLRLAPRKRWVAFLYGLVLGFLGAQSFYTGRVFRGALQAAPVVSAWLLTLITLGMLAPLAQVVTVVVWIWGAAEGIAYLVSRSGTYSVDVLGGRLT